MASKQNRRLHRPPAITLDRSASVVYGAVAVFTPMVQNDPKVPRQQPELLLRFRLRPVERHYQLYMAPFVRLPKIKYLSYHDEVAFDSAVVGVGKLSDECMGLEHDVSKALDEIKTDRQMQRDQPLAPEVEQKLDEAKNAVLEYRKQCKSYEAAVREMMAQLAGTEVDYRLFVKFEGDSPYEVELARSRGFLSDDEERSVE